MRLKKPEKPEIQGICVLCKSNKQTSMGNGRYRPVCYACHSARGKKKVRAEDYKERYAYRKLKKSYCDKCGFVAEHSCQMDIDHIDGNRDNQDKCNIQTLCSNCHRLKTHIDLYS